MTNPTATLEQTRFVKATRNEQTDGVPIWLMRQAGRYMPEYRELRGKYKSILEAIKEPEVAMEITLQPIDAFDLDAGIIFADILPILETMGLDLEFLAGEGPVIHNPIRSVADVEKLTTPEPREALDYTIEAVRITSQELAKRGIPLIGFAGAPFTIASYAVEGGSSKNKLHLKSMMYSEPAAWDKMMTKFADVTGEYLIAQVEAGAQVLQVFDSWVGELAPNDFRKYVLPYSQQVIEKAKSTGVPVIYFGTNTSAMLTDMRDAGSDVVGVDWRINIDEAAKILGDGVAIQGNLDPVALFAPWDELKQRAQDILDRMDGRKGFIFNLGHGILQHTPVDNVKRLCEFVHEYTTK